MALTSLCSISNSIIDVLQQSVKVSKPHWKDEDVIRVLNVFDFINSRTSLNSFDNRIQQLLDVGIPEGWVDFLFPMEVKIDPNNLSHLNVMETVVYKDPDNIDNPLDPMLYAQSLRLIANSFKKDSLSLRSAKLTDLRLPKSVTEVLAKSQYGDSYHADDSQVCLPVPLTVQLVELSYYNESFTYLTPRLAMRVAAELVK